jgi:hypothetical protein
MPIMAAHDENDARGSARVLASTVRKCIDDAGGRRRPLSFLNNLYMMLEDYRSHGFVGFAYEPSSARGPEALTLLPPTERHVQDLRFALDRALEEAYRGTEKDVALDRVESVLKSVAYPDDNKTADEADRRTVSEFLRVFIDNLYPKP